MTTLPTRLKGDGPCHDCGTTDNICWYTESPFWNEVIGGPGTFVDPGGIFCIPCFIKRVDRAGFTPTGWRLTPEWPWSSRPRCQDPACPDFGDPDFGEGTCPAEHAEPRTAAGSSARLTSGETP